MFLKDQRRFSFVYGGEDIFSLNLKKSVEEKENETHYIYETEDGLKFTNICRYYEKYNAYEWVTWFENKGSSNSKILSQINDGDIKLPFDRDIPRPWTAFVTKYKEEDIRVYNPCGSDWNIEEFGCDSIDRMVLNEYANHLSSGKSKIYTPFGGRSSQGRAPFFNLYCKNRGFVVAVGWTGQWKCEITRTEEDVQVKSGIENAEFYLKAGEKIRTSSIVVMGYEGDFADSQNKWRRFVKEHFSLIGKENRAQHGPLCMGIWGGQTTEAVLERINFAKKHNLPYEYLWMDAGWYGTSTKESPDEFEGDWLGYAGDWRINPHIHPDGLVEVSKAANKAGMKFLLWFEPERAFKGVKMLNEHPEYFLYCEGQGLENYLLDLGNEEAYNYCYNVLSSTIERLNIKFYRQDFNMDPLNYWLKADGENRKGITEIKHIMGLYRLWDELLAKFPDLNIDNCSSGGRRLDIETMRRSMPLWRSDTQCPADWVVEFAQAQNMQYGLWMPHSGTGSGRDIGDEYRIRSAYAGSLTTNYFFSQRTPFPTDEQAKWIRKYLNEYLQVRDYFYGDMYNLTEPVESEYSWNAVQYNLPERGDGMVQAFRHGKSPFAQGCFKLYGLESAKAYRITDLDNNETVEISGKELMDKGLKIETDAPRTAKIFLYEVM